MRGESSYFDKPLNMKNEDDGVYIDLLNSLDYGVSVASKGSKNEKEKHIIQDLSRLSSGVGFLPNDPSQLIDCYCCSVVRRLEITIVLMKHQPF